MKNILVICICTLSFSASAQIKNLRGIVINHQTKRSVPYASVILLKADLAINTETDGTFNINVPDDPCTDTLVIKHFHYDTLKIPVLSFKNGSVIELNEQQPSLANEPVVKQDNTKLILNKFNKKATRFYIGLNKYNYRFNHEQIAQKLNVPVANAKLLSIVIQRMRDVSKVVRDYDPHTKFLIHIYDVNAQSGSPGKELSSQCILVQNKSSEIIDIDLSKYNVVIPGKQFFVAIEWLRIDFNELVNFAVNDPGGGFVFKENQENYKGYIRYHPIIGMSGTKGNELNTWALNFQGQWAPYTYFSPDLTDFAISAEVAY